MRAILFFILVTLLSCSTTTPNRILRYDDPGGKLYVYASLVKAAQRDGTPVALKGYCGSACTIFLALPKNQLCLYPGTVLLFHAAYGGTPSGNKWATNFVFSIYPDWVQRWIRNEGGLTSKTLTMPYEYSKQYTRKC